MTNDELYHYGILGMKWGIRRYQNKDGTYTSEGKARKNAQSSGNSSSSSNSKVSSKTSSTKTSIKDISDDDLRRAVNRLQLEKQYRELMASPKKVSAGKELVSDILRTSGKTVGVAVATYALGKAVNTLFDAEIVKTAKKEEKGKGK